MENPAVTPNIVEQVSPSGNTIDAQGVAGDLKHLSKAIHLDYYRQSERARIVVRRYDILSISQLILSVLLSLGVFATVFGDNKIVGIITAIASALVAIFSGYFKAQNLVDAITVLNNVKAGLRDLRSRVNFAITDLAKGQQSFEAVSEKRNELLREYTEILKSVPRISTSMDKKLNRLTQVPQGFEY